MNEQTVSAGYARALLDFAVSRGADAAALLAAAGIAQDELADQDTRLPLRRFKALMDAAKSLCRDPALALHFGASSSFVEMSIVGLIAHASATMSEAFEQMNRYARLVIDPDAAEGARFAIRRGGGEVWIEDCRRNSDDFPDLTQSTWARFVSDYARAFPKRASYVTAVHVTHARPPYADEYAAVLKAPVTFSSDRNALRISEDWLAMRLGPANRYVFGIFSARADELLKSLQSSRSVRGRVERLLIPILHTGQAGMPFVARTMGLSRATLYRRLKAEDVRFDALLDDLRKRMAQHYLNGRKLSVGQTAYLVGFSDTSSFSRAFKRWTGARPSETKPV